MSAKIKTLLPILLTTVTVVVVCVLFIGKVFYVDSTTNSTDNSNSDSITMVTVTINYYYYNEEFGIDASKYTDADRPYSAFVANMPKSSTTMTEKTPTLTGYAPATDDESITFTLDKDQTFNVFYYPLQVSYEIKLYKQNLNDDGYTLSKILNCTGTAGKSPVEFENGGPETIEGFTRMYYVPEVIKADGTTQFECYYDRNYYRVDVDLGDGGYGVEPIYAKYGSLLTVGTPKRAGYTFNGWTVSRSDSKETSDTVPSTVPAYDIKLTANWSKTDEVTYTVVFKNADVKKNKNDDTTYSYWGSVELKAYPGTQISLSDIIRDYKDQIRSYTDYQYFEFDEATTKDPNNNPDTITVAGDGSTSIQLYYTRKKYTIRFVYAREWNQNNEKEIQVCKSTGTGTYGKANTNNKYITSGSLYWNYATTELPDVTLPEVGDRNIQLNAGSDCYYTDNLGNKLYYISVTAEYDADIQDVWPSTSKILSDIEGGTWYELSSNASYTSSSDRILNKTHTGLTFKFGSWAIQNNLRKANSNLNDNLTGSYPTMSKDLIDLDSTDQLSDGSYLAQTMFAWWGGNSDNISDHTYYIYYEALPTENENETTFADTNFAPDDGETKYKLSNKTITFSCAHNNDTQVFPFSYDGLILQNTAASYSSTKFYNSTNQEYYTKFYYKRARNSIQFSNNGAIVGDMTINNIMYGENLSTYKSKIADPPYPSEWESGKYKFKGWYTDETYKTEFDWDNTEMPNATVTLYAYWQPMEYTINFYNDESEYLNSGKAIVETKASYSTFINADDISKAEKGLTPPKYTVNDTEYTADKVGWFYYDSSGVEHSFDPKTMSVSGSMDLFMVWSTNQLTFFTVSYVTKDGTKVADDITSSSFVGLVRTFSAKASSELYPDFQVGYFPETNSISLLMNENEELNKVKFTYVQSQTKAIEYTIRYIDADNNKEISPSEKRSSETPVVTEYYKPITNYVPMNYSISLTLTVNDDGTSDTEHNVITFYYKYNSNTMLCNIEYLFEEDDGTYTSSNYKDIKFKWMSGIEDPEDVGTTKVIDLISRTGYTAASYEITNYDGNKTATDGGSTSIDANATSISVDLDKSGTYVVKNIRIYYTKDVYKLKVVYEVNSDDSKYINLWDNALTTAMGSTLTADDNSKTDDGYYTKYYQIVDGYKYNSTYTTKDTSNDAPKLEGFELLGEQYSKSQYSKSIVVKVDDDNFSNNIINFTYEPIKTVMFQYEAVCPSDASGSTSINYTIENALTRNQESATIGERPASKVEALLEVGNYRFVAWYTDEQCTKPVVNDSNNSVLTGDNNKNNILLPLGSDCDIKYYAKYEYLSSDLIIINSGVKVDTESQAFEYIVEGADSSNSSIKIKVCIVGNGRKTIKGLPVGNYTVKQSDWSWRYKSSSQNVYLKISDGATVTFDQSNSMSNTKWLDGNLHTDRVLNKQ